MTLPLKNNRSVLNPSVKNLLGKLANHDTSWSFLSGVLLVLSFPKFGTGLFAWVALIPLFYALQHAESMKRGIFLGFITGVVGYVGIIYWIAYVIVLYGHLPLYIGIALMLLLACYLALYVSLFAGLVVYFRDKISLCLVAPALWVCFEYGKSFILTGFPWENLGYSQYLNTYFIQIADVAGVFGLSFLIVLFNTALFCAVYDRNRKAYLQLIIVMVMMTAVYAYGMWRLGHIRNAVDRSPGMNVLLVQGNIDQSIKWNRDFQFDTIKIYEYLSLRHLPGDNSLIVWPETALPFRFQDFSYLRQRIINLSRETNSWMVFGSISSSPRQGTDDHFNSAYLLSPSGEVTGRYDKVHLVPYGEYVPLRNVLPFVKGFTAGIGDFASGRAFHPLTMEDQKIGVLICYEGILPRAVRDYKNRSARLLVNITNDAWFGKTSAPYQHFSMTVFRAVETRLFLIRAANTGVSGIVDPAGKVIAATNIFTRDAVAGHIKFVDTPTLYSRYGDFIVVFSFVLLIGCFMISLKGRAKKWQ